MSYHYIKSYLGDGVIDIKGAKPPLVPPPGTKLDSWAQKTVSPDDENQLWKFEEYGEKSGWYYITSQLGGLVIDIQGGSPPASGTPLDAFTKKTVPANVANQLWLYEPDTTGNYPGYGFIVSNSDANLVIDVTGGELSNGVPLQVYLRKTTDYENQLWMLVNP